MQRVWESTFLGLPAVVKQRFKKGYRHPKLDQQITSSRLKQEVRSMLRARKLGVQTPTIYAVDEVTSCICMQRVDGVSLKEMLLRSHADHEWTNARGLVQDLGSLIAKLHDGGVVHGDLTTSNALVVAHQEEGTVEENRNAGYVTQHTIFLIDFGLSYFSNLAEDRAVDLYVLERAFVSAHAVHGEQLFQTLLDSYRRTSRAWSSTFNKFSEGKF